MDNWEEYCKSLIPKMKARFKQMMGFEPNLENPQRLTEKLARLGAELELRRCGSSLGPSQYRLASTRRQPAS